MTPHCATCTCLTPKREHTGACLDAQEAYTKAWNADHGRWTAYVEGMHAEMEEASKFCPVCE